VLERLHGFCPKKKKKKVRVKRLVPLLLAPARRRARPPGDAKAALATVVYPPSLGLPSFVVAADLPDARPELTKYSASGGAAALPAAEPPASRPKRPALWSSKTGGVEEL